MYVLIKKKTMYHFPVILGYRDVQLYILLLLIAIIPIAVATILVIIIFITVSFCCENTIYVKFVY